MNTWIHEQWTRRIYNAFDSDTKVQQGNEIDLPAIMS